MDDAGEDRVLASADVVRAALHVHEADALVVSASVVDRREVEDVVKLGSVQRLIGEPRRNLVCIRTVIPRWVATHGLHCARRLGLGILPDRSTQDRARALWLRCLRRRLRR